MENVICGPCAKKAELNLATRVHLAKSRKLDVEYVCPECGSTHSWTYGRNEEDLPEQPTEIAEMAEIAEIPEVKEIFIQTSLF